MGGKSLGGLPCPSSMIGHYYQVKDGAWTCRYCGHVDRRVTVHGVHNEGDESRDE